MTMYRFSPIHEITAEFKFRSDEAWDPMVTDLLYESLRTSYPLKRVGRRIEVQPQVVDGQVQPLVKDQAGEVQCLAADQKSGVKLDVNLFSIFRAAPYPGWPQWRDQILDVLHSYIEIAGPSAFEQMRLHYVNRLLLPPGKSNVDISSIFEIWPRVPPKLGHSFGRFLLKVELPDPQLKGNLILSAGIADNPGGQPPLPALILDLDFVSGAGPMSLEIAPDWLEGSHKKIKDVFEACITDEARRRFQGLT